MTATVWVTGDGPCDHGKSRSPELSNKLTNSFYKTDLEIARLRAELLTPPVCLNLAMARRN
ncbi:hypothetical protein [Rhizobium acidisoli]|uniref:hypothetical protein n=1 Tax=Rhizobium acidisoli TaxID=1538158 RepID=UPI000A647E9A